jgi:hypothetical protein
MSGGAGSGLGRTEASVLAGSTGCEASPRVADSRQESGPGRIAPGRAVLTDLMRRPAARLAARRAPLAPTVVVVAALAACAGGPGSTAGTGAASPSTADNRAAGGGIASSGAAAGTASAGTAGRDPAGGRASSGAGAAAGAKVDACKVLTAQDATAILGQPVGTGRDGGSLGIPYPSCTYTATGGDLATVGLTIFDATASANLIDEYRSQYPGLSALSGVGDAAVAGSDGRLVVATKGTRGCVVLRAGDVTGPVEAATQLLAGVCRKALAAG